MRLLLDTWSGCRRGDFQKYALIQVLLVLGLVASCCVSCPDKCFCFSQTVKCQNQGLEEIPDSLPTNTKALFVTGNSISRIGVDSFPTRLDQLTDLYLSGNDVEYVDAMVFDKLPALVRLDLSNNDIQNFSDRAFPVDNKLQVLNLSRSFLNHSTVNAALGFLQTGNHVHLTALDLSNNDLVLLPVGIFTSLPNLVNLSLQNSSIISVLNGTLTVPPLQDLDLRDNSLRNLPTSTLTEFKNKPGLLIRLAGNPWRCDCFIDDLLDWLKNSTQVPDIQSMTCGDPEGLRRRSLLQVQQTQLKCPTTHMGDVLETSYVFLGLVLALIGVIFILVLYLNRRGIKRWINNIRDACRDHMEGYHYRYEVNSYDARLANLSVNLDL